MASIYDDERYEKILDYFNDLSEEDIVDMHNAYCEESNYDEDIIYRMYEINDMLSDYEPAEILNLVGEKHFDSTEDFFRFTKKGIESSVEPLRDGWIEIGDIIIYIINSEDWLGHSAIAEILFES